MFMAGRRSLCLLGQSINVLAGLVMLCMLPWVMHRSGLLRSDDSSSLPLTRLVLGLGLGCGVIGRAAVAKLGGGTTNWGLAWGCWVTLHLVLQWFAAKAAAQTLKKVDRAYQRRRNPDDDDDTRDDVNLASDSLGTLATTMYVMQGLVLPAVLAWSTFYAVDLASCGWRFW